jgi:hypothetical protein
MPDVQEVFRMATQKVTPDPGALERQNRNQRRRSTQRKIGAFALVAAIVAIGIVAAIAALGSNGTRSPASQPSPTPTVQDVMKLEGFAPLKPGTYFIDPDRDPATPLRVVYDIPVEGWSQWIGAVKFTGNGHLGVSITTVTNMVRHGCSDHSPADPPVGPSVDDLTTALADLAPFRVTSPPKDVTIHGYSGKHLELTVPDAGCTAGSLESWMSANLGPPGDNAFSGYNLGGTEEFWILDVDGTRLVIEANWAPASPREDVAEMRAILDSIRIVP